MNYIKSKTCANCGNIDTIELTKQEAAFEELRKQKYTNTPCSRCNSLEFGSITYPKITYEEEIMDEWGSNLKLHFMCQDEEIILADLANLFLIIRGLESKNYLKTKKNQLLEALCVLLYDFTYPSDEFSSEKVFSREKEAELVRIELIKRKNQLEAIQNDLFDYIKEIVFPQIGIEF